MSNTVTVHLYQISPQSEASGSGSLVLTAGSGGSYTAKANIDFAGVGNVAEDMTGSSATVGGRTVINLSSRRIQFALVQNPFATNKVSFGGSGSLDGRFIYNVTAT